ncbi:MAG TPA: M48 family metallopeptidase [Thermoanaerobaculia bacterium]|jgi:predicted Zn-dependent protease
MFRLRSYALLFAVALVAAGCGSSGGVGGVSLDEEWQLGNQLAAQVQQQVRLVNDPVALSYVRSVGERIHAQTPLADRPFNFYIVDDPEVNAFSLPGGHVYVNRGLIDRADKADELAAVMSHEIAHVVARHAIKQAQQAQEINALGSILLGNNPNALSQLAAQVLAGGAMARFSRADEKQADDMGLDLMYRAGYDAHGMLDFFNKLLAMEQGGDNAVTRFFRDHPGTSDRIADIQGRLPNYPSRPGQIVDDQGFHDLKARV